MTKKIILTVMFILLFIATPIIGIFCERYFQLSSGEVAAIVLPSMGFMVGMVAGIIAIWSQPDDKKYQ